MSVISSFPHSVGKCWKYIMHWWGAFRRALIPVRGAAEKPHPSKQCCVTCQSGWVTGRTGRDSRERGRKVIQLSCTKVLPWGWTSTSGPCLLSWIILPKVTALPHHRDWSPKSAASRALRCSWAYVFTHFVLSAGGFVAVPPVLMGTYPQRATPENNLSKLCGSRGALHI